MKLLGIDTKENTFTCIPETADDLWHLEKIIAAKDIVYGHTDRKIKPLNEGEKARRILLTIELEVTDIHFQEYSGQLRINGIILSGKPEEFIELRSHHSLEIPCGEKVKVKKTLLGAWHIQRLKKAQATSVTNQLLVVLLDDEQADLAFINPYAIAKKATIKESRGGKRFVQEKSEYLAQIFEKLIALEPKKVVLAGPGFMKENLKKFIEDKKMKGLPSLLLESTNAIGEPGFKELLASGKLDAIEKQLHLTKESQLIEAFLAKAPKQLAEYGVEHVRSALSLGAVETVLVSETYLLQNRADAEALLNAAEQSGATIEIISAKNPQEKTIHGYGGVVATLRYKLE